MYEYSEKDSLLERIKKYIECNLKKPGARCTIFKNLQVTKYKLQVISY
jgi:hypothetical protein